MRAWHMAMCERILYIPAMLDGINSKFYHLSDDTNRDGDNKYEIRLKRFHRITLIIKLDKLVFIIPQEI